tara:strand:- start:853 stop:1182 length:330 start_codon:yes stop_codon:yes gene_type:complete
MSWENLLKRDVYEGDPRSDRFHNESARETYDWFMATMAGNKHPKGDVHDNNLLYIFMGHVKRAFEEDKTSREYKIADKIFKSLQENEQLSYELYELLSSKITPEERQIE